jgi:nitrite reductase (NADH) small subunit
MSEFVSVAEVASLLPGQGRTVNHRGREYALYNVDGKFHAMDDACPHKGGPLGAGCLEADQVYCPLHGWAFDIKTGICAMRPDLPVRTYETRVEGNHVQIKV